jgi:hypothetical protein
VSVEPGRGREKRGRGDCALHRHLAVTIHGGDHAGVQRPGERSGAFCVDSGRSERWWGVEKRVSRGGAFYRQREDDGWWLWPMVERVGRHWKNERRFADVGAVGGGDVGVEDVSRGRTCGGREVGRVGEVSGCVVFLFRILGRCE